MPDPPNPLEKGELEITQLKVSFYEGFRGDRELNITLDRSVATTSVKRYRATD